MRPLKAAGLLVPVLICPSWLVAQILIKFGGDGFSKVMTARSLRDIRSGQADPAWYGVTARLDATWIAPFEAAKSIFGFNWVHSLIRSFDLSHLLLPDDNDAKACFQLLNYMWGSPQVSSFSYPSVYADRTDIQEWISACRKAWPELGKEEQALLERFRSEGRIPLDVLVPEAEDNAAIKKAARARQTPVYEKTVKMTREEIKTLLKDSMAQSMFGQFGVHEVPGKTLDYYASLNIRKPMEIEGTWEAVGKAIRLGQITKFDARKLLPKELFNISFETMTQWEGPSAERTPVFMDNVMPSSLSEFAKAKKPFTSEDKRRTFVSVASEAVSVVHGNGWLFGRNLSDRFWAVNGHMHPAGYIHTRRLPTFHKKLPEVEKLMGIEEDVLRGQSQLWMGATVGGFHYDEEANVYIQLSGTTYAFLVPQNWTDYFTGAERHPWNSAGLPGVREVEKDPPLKNVPIFLTALNPGDGVTLQGRTYHRFVAQTNDRIALNWFFIPGWRKMEYTPADWYAVEAEKSLTRLALRQLWARTLARVYDDTGRGVIYMGKKLEYL